MPDLTKGHTFATGDVVTAANLNTLLDDATINDDAVNADMMAANAITNASVSSSAAIELSKLEKPTDGKIIVGRASDGAAVAVALSGDATIIADGTLTVADDAITTDKIIDNAVDGTKIAMTSDAQGDILIRGAANYERLAKPSTPAGEVLTFVTGASDPAWATPDGTGSVLQVVYADLDTDTFSSTSTTMEQITGLTASITPGSASNYILIQAMISYGMQYENSSAFGIYSGLTSGQIGSSGEAASGARNAIVSSANNPYQGGLHQAQLFSANMQYRDAPTTWTSGAIAYTVTVSNNDVGPTGGPGFTLNKPYIAVATTVSTYGRSSIILTEIKG